MRRPLALAILALGTLLAGAATAAGPAKPPVRPDDLLARAQELLDRGQPEEVAKLLAPLVGDTRPDPRALLLVSSAAIQLGDEAAGRRDLERALAIDPKLRQAWLNLAAMEIAAKRYDKAQADLETAQKLDPAAHDSEINLGAVLLLQGKLEPANGHFQRYLGLESSSANAFYLVATNYASAGYSALALQHLAKAIELDERSRLRARTDPNFADLASQPQLQQLLARDAYQPPAGAYRARQVYPVRYDSHDGKLLDAVLDALRTAREPFDPTVEVTDAWALVWGEMRIKVGRDAGGGGAVELSAPPERMTPAEWERRSTRLLREILIHLPP